MAEGTNEVVDVDRVAMLEGDPEMRSCEANDGDATHAKACHGSSKRKFTVKTISITKTKGETYLKCTACHSRGSWYGMGAAVQGARTVPKSASNASIWHGGTRVCMGKLDSPRR